MVARTIESYAYLTSVIGLEFVPIRFHCRAMGDEQGMAHDPAFSAAVTLRALAPITRTTRGEQPRIVPQYGTAPRLVERYPELDF